MKRLLTLMLLALAALSFSHTKAKTPAPMTFTVTNTGASGPGSFAQALADANANPGTDTIAFNIPGSGPHTIQTNSFLGVADPVIIDGYTQPGASPNTNPPNLGTNAVLKIELDQSISGGLVFFTDNCVVRGLVINRSPFSAVYLRGSNHVIEGNFIGTDITGTLALGNNGSAIVSDNGDNNLIGGTSAAARNLISGNNGIAVLIGGGNDNKVQGNLLGTDRTGLLALGNVDNIALPGPNNTLIGGTNAAARNVISASRTFFGVHIYLGAAGTVVQGNYIGTDVTGTQPLGNNNVGVAVEGVGPTPVSNTLIGGAALGAGNVIARSNGHGVAIGGGALQTVVQGNSIGTDASGALNLGNVGDGVQIFDSACQIGGVAAGAGNKIAFNDGTGVAVVTGAGAAILSNSIYANGGLGIDLAEDGVTVNDAGDADTGANNLQNHPVLTAVTCAISSAAIQGMLNSTPNTTFRIEFFANAACDASGSGEGATFLSALSVTTDGSGSVSFTVPVSITSGQNVTATATDPNNNTSEFSPCLLIPTLPPVPDLATLPTVTGQCSVTVTAPTAHANCAGLVTATTTDPTTYTTQGTFTIHWIYDDGHGNITTQTQTVIVKDTSAPVITTANKTVSTDLNLCAAQVSHGTTASDNCALASLVGTRSDGAALADPYPKGTTTISWKATDQAGNNSTTAQTITVIDTQKPVIVCPTNLSLAGNILGSCGANVNVVAPTAADNCGVTSIIGTRSDGQPLGVTYPPGLTTITWIATDTSGNQAACTSTVTVTNDAPLVTITGPASGALFIVGTPVTFTGTFTDNPGGTHTANWLFDTISQPGTVNESAHTVSATYTFNAAGVYLVTLSISDGCGKTGAASSVDGLTAMVVIYDPNGGFVTGGGWINSPAGAYVANPTLTGKASFGFVSKYVHGANVPTGNTEFQFQTANFNFHSTSYDWLVVAGARAQYKGSGTVNNSGDYSFLLTAVDGQLSGGGGTDKFRIKVWDKATGNLVYDNQMGAADGEEPSTVIQGGSIVIHQ